MVSELDGETFRQQVREAQHAEIWRRMAFFSWTVGIVLSLAIVVVEAARGGCISQCGPPRDRWLFAAIIPLVFLPFAPTFYWIWHLRRYFRMMKVTGRAVTPREVGTGEWRIETFLEKFVGTKWWRLIVAGIFTVIIGYKLLRLLTG